MARKFSFFQWICFGAVLNLLFCASALADIHSKDLKRVSKKWFSLMADKNNPKSDAPKTGTHRAELAALFGLSNSKSSNLQTLENLLGWPTVSSWELVVPASDRFEMSGEYELNLVPTRASQVYPLSMNTVMVRQLAAMPLATWARQFDRIKQLPLEAVQFILTLHQQVDQISFPSLSPKLLYNRFDTVVDWLKPSLNSDKLSMIKTLEELSIDYSNTMLITMEAASFDEFDSLWGDESIVDLESLMDEEHGLEDQYWQYYEDCDHWKVDFGQSPRRFEPFDDSTQQGPVLLTATTVFLINQLDWPILVDELNETIQMDTLEFQLIETLEFANKQ